MNPITDIVAGAVLRVLGRKLFWLFVAIAGFYLGFAVSRAAWMKRFTAGLSVLSCMSPIREGVAGR